MTNTDEITDGFSYTYSLSGKTGIVETGPFLADGECNVRIYGTDGQYETTAIAMDRALIAGHIKSGIYQTS